MGVFTTAAKTWGAEPLKSSDLNAQIRDLINGFGAWNSSASSPAYSPTLSGFTLGSGTISGAYTQIGKHVHFRVTATLGTGYVAPTQNPAITLPVAAASTSRDYNITAKFATSGGTVYQAGAVLNTTSQIYLYVLGTNGVMSTPTSTVPFSWGVGSVLYVGGTYEAA